MDFSLALDFDWVAPTQRPVPTSASPFLTAIQTAEKAIAGYSQKLSEAVGKNLPIYIDWSFLSHPNFAKLNATQMIGFLHQRVVENTTTYGQSLSYLCRDAYAKRAVADNINGVLYFIDPLDRINSTVAHQQSKWYHLHIQNNILVVSVNLDNIDKQSYPDYETKLFSLFHPSPVILSAIEATEKKIAAECQKKLIETAGKPITIQVDWSFFSHPKFPKGNDGKKMIESIFSETVKNSTTYGTSLNSMMNSNKFAKQFVGTHIDAIHYRIDMDDGIKSTIGPAQTSWYELSLNNRVLTVSVNFSHYDNRQGFNNYDIKFNNLFYPSPATLLLIEKAESTVEEYTKKIEQTVGKNIPVKIDWSFCDTQEFRVKQLSEQKDVIENIANTFVKFATVNGESLQYLASKNAEIKSALFNNVSRYVIQFDAVDAVKSPIGNDQGRWYHMSLTTTGDLVLRSNLSEYKKYSLYCFLDKLNNALFAAPPVEAAPAPVAAAPVVEETPLQKAIVAATAKIDKMAEKLQPVFNRAVPLVVDWTFTTHPAAAATAKAVVDGFPNQLVENSIFYGTTLVYLSKDVHVKNALKASVDRILFKIDMDNSIKGTGSGSWYTLALFGRDLVLTANWANCDPRNTVPDFDTKLYALFNPSPLVLTLIDKAEKAKEDLQKGVNEAIGKPVALVVNWRFTESPLFTKAGDCIVDNVIKFSTTNGGTLTYLVKQNANIKQFFIDKVDSIVYSFDAEDKVNSSVGNSQSRFYEITFDGRSVHLLFNLTNWDATSIYMYDTKLNNALFPPATEAASPAAPTPTPAPVVSTMPEMKPVLSTPAAAAISSLPTPTPTPTPVSAPSVVSVASPVATPTPAAATPAAAPVPTPAGFPEGARADLIAAAQKAEKAMDEFRMKLQSTIKKPSFNVEVDWSFLVHPDFLSRSDLTTVISNVAANVGKSTLVYGESVHYLCDRQEVFRNAFHDRVDGIVIVLVPDNNIKCPGYTQSTFYDYVFDADAKKLFFRINLEEHGFRQITNIRERIEATLDLLTAFLQVEAQKRVEAWTPKLKGRLSIELDWSFASSPAFQSLSRNDKLKFGNEHWEEFMRGTIHSEGFATQMENETVRVALLERIDKIIYAIDPTNSIKSPIGYDYWDAKVDDERRAVVITLNINNVGRMTTGVADKLEAAFDFSRIKAVVKVKDACAALSSKLSALGSPVFSVDYNSFEKSPKYTSHSVRDRAEYITKTIRHVERIAELLLEKLPALNAKYTNIFQSGVKNVVFAYATTNVRNDNVLDEEREGGVAGLAGWGLSWYKVNHEAASKTATITMLWERMDENLNYVAEKLAPYLDVYDFETVGFAKGVAESEQALQKAVGASVPFTLDSSLYRTPEYILPTIPGKEYDHQNMKFRGVVSDVQAERMAVRATNFNKSLNIAASVVACFTKRICSYGIGASTSASKVKGVKVIPLATGVDTVDFDEPTGLLTVSVSIASGSAQKGGKHVANEGRAIPKWAHHVEFLLGLTIPLYKLRAEDTIKEKAGPVTQAIGKDVPIVLDWGFLDTEKIRGFDADRLDTFLHKFSTSRIHDLAIGGIVKTAANPVGLASIQKSVNSVHLAIDFCLAKDAIADINAAGELKIVIIDANKELLFDNYIQGALDLIVQIALYDTKKTFDEVTASLSTTIGHPVTVEIDITSFNRAKEFLDLTADIQSRAVRYLSDSLLLNLKTAVERLAKYEIGLNALKANFKTVRIGLAVNGDNASSKGILSASSGSVVNVLIGLQSMSFHDPASVVIKDWHFQLGRLFNVDNEVAKCEADTGIKASSQQGWDNIMGASPIAVNWATLTENAGFKGQSIEKQWSTILHSVSAVSQLLLGSGIDAVTYLTQFSAMKDLLNQKFNNVRIEFAERSGVAHAGDSLVLNVPVELAADSQFKGIRRPLENLFSLRPLVELEVLKEVTAVVRASEAKVAELSGKQIAVDIELDAVVAAKKDDYVSAIRMGIAVGKLSILGTAGICALMMSNHSARNELAQRYSRIKVKVDPTNSTRPHIGRFVADNFDVFPESVVLVIKGDLERNNYGPYANAQWILSPETARAEEQAELERLERERIRQEEERRRREEEDRRRKAEEEEQRRRDEEERRRKEEERKAEDWKRYHRDLAYYNERASKQCVRCYGSKTNPCHGCDGGKKQNKSRCSYCDGKTTVRCPSCAGTGKLDPYLTPPKPPSH